MRMMAQRFSRSAWLLLILGGLASPQAASAENAAPARAGAACGAAALRVPPGADIAALVRRSAEGTSFCLGAGEHRMQAITPRRNQSFHGEPGAVLNGSRLLTRFTRQGNHWAAQAQMAGSWQRRDVPCAQHAPRCGYPQAVFIDDIPLAHVGRLADVAEGKYFIDYDAGRVHLGSDPRGRRVELSVTAFAFQGGATGVTVRNLVVEKYASPVQHGAIGGYDGAAGWLIEGNEVRLNYGVGIKAGEGTRVVGNLVHNNGQLGVGAVGAGILVADNEIAANGFWSGINTGWEGGGSKFAFTVDLVVRGNFVHGNNGHGLWTDIDNIGTLYEGNRVENNVGSGIAHEISYSAVIRDNMVVGNGTAYHDWLPGAWLWGAGILIQNSSDVQVYRNTVDMTGSGQGIALIQQDRGAGAQGPWLTTGNSVHDNVIINRTPSEGKSGAVADYDFEGMARGGNIFDHNEYRLANPEEARFAWGQYYDWTDYRARSGQDRNSTIRPLPPPDRGR